MSTIIFLSFQEAHKSVLKLHARVISQLLFDRNYYKIQVIMNSQTEASRAEGAFEETSLESIYGHEQESRYFGRYNHCARHRQ